MSLYIQTPITEISALLKDPWTMLESKVIHLTDSKILSLINEILNNQEQKKFKNFDFTKLRYIIYTRNAKGQRHTFIMHQGILWINEDKCTGFPIDKKLWDRFTKFFKGIALSPSKSGVMEMIQEEKKD